MSNLSGSMGGGNTSSSPFAANQSGPPTTSTSLFGSRTANTDSSGGFGQTSSVPNKPLFAGLTTDTTTSSPGLGTTAVAGGASKPLFGNIGSGTSTGSSQSTPAFSFSSLGVTSTSAPPSGGLFGSAPVNTPAAGNANGGFNFVQRQTGTLNSSGTENLPATAPGSGAFGHSSSGVLGSTTAPAPVGSLTPASAKTPSLGSTTPAGPPPSSAAQSNTGGIFAGSNPPTSAASVFGAASSADNRPTGGLFANLANSNVPATANPSSPALFAGLNASNTINLAGSTGQASKPPSFTFPTASTTASSEAPSIPTTTAPSLFGGLQSPSIPTTSTSSSANSSANLFGATKPAVSMPASTSNMFGGAKSVSTPDNKSVPTPATESFAGTVKPATAATTQMPAATLSTLTPASSIFGAATTSTAPSAQGASLNANQPASVMQTADRGGAKTAVPNLAASTSGPPPQHNRLKNKTMDEIITRWASDLSRYQKEFQEQATKVAVWDRLLVENGMKIQQLYNSTFEAERASAEVERQLTHVEGLQDELTSWLDTYERDMEEMHARQVGPGDMLQGPDQERERTYKIAENLTDKLEDMGKDLTKMVDGMNAASLTLNKNNQSDDPLSHIVQVLNSHLRQLQWIDQNTKSLQEKVNNANRVGQSIGANGYGGLESDAAGSFYRSYMSRR